MGVELECWGTPLEPHHAGPSPLPFGRSRAEALRGRTVHSPARKPRPNVQVSPGCATWQSLSRTGTRGSALSQGCPTRPSQWHQRLCCQQHGLCEGTFKPNPRISWSVSGVLQQRPRRVVASWSTLGPRKQLDGYSRLSQTKPARGLLSPTRFSNTCAPSADRLRHSERLVRVRCSHVSQRMGSIHATSGSCRTMLWKGCAAV